MLYVTNVSSIVWSVSQMTVQERHDNRPLTDPGRFPEPQASNHPAGRKRFSQRIPLSRLAPVLLFVAGIGATVAGLWLYNLLAPPPDPLSPVDVVAIAADVVAAATPAPAYSASVYETILPSLVYIRVGDSAPSGDGSTAKIDSPFANTLYLDDSPGPTGPVEPETVQNGDPFGPGSSGIGSGVVVNSSGMILTALHVVARAGTIEILFADGTRATGEIVGAEPDNDIAVLQADRLPELFAPAVLGNPGAMRVGDEVYAVGNPLGLAGSISAGVISGFDRTFVSPYGGPDLERLIQFDAAVNPGNSGGPLLNRDGEVIGIVVALVNPTGAETFMGIGLAVRIDNAGGAAGLPPQ